MRFRVLEITPLTVTASMEADEWIIVADFPRDLFGKGRLKHQYVTAIKGEENFDQDFIDSMVIHLTIWLAKNHSVYFYGIKRIVWL